MKLNEFGIKQGFVENYPVLEHMDATVGQEKKFPEYFKKRKEYETQYGFDPKSQKHIKITKEI